MSDFRVLVESDGRMALPPEVRRRMGVEAGGQLFIREEEGRFMLETLQSAVIRAQAIVREYIPHTGTRVDEFIADRRAEADRE